MRMNIPRRENPDRHPVRVSGVWEVYSGQQLRYAMLNYTSGDTIKLMSNIDMNGDDYQWDMVINSKGLTFEGNNFTIFNLGCYSKQKNETIGGALYLYSTAFLEIRNSGLVMNNVTFDTMKTVTANSPGLLNNNQFSYAGRDCEFYSVLTNANIQNSLFWGEDYASPFGCIGIDRRFRPTSGNASKVSNCSTKGNYVYGKADHMSGFATGLGHQSPAVTTVTNSFSADNLLCSSGGHSGGFNSCHSSGGVATQTGGVVIKNCFATNELYGSAAVAGFVGFAQGTISDCFSSGKVEGYANLAGFYIGAGNHGSAYIDKTTISNCYSTALVGLRSSPQLQGGFFSEVLFAQNQYFNKGNVIIKDCYSAGEVGNYDVSMSAPKDIGGFQNITTNGVVDAAQTANCYYDKQTSAMREWASGDTQTLAGVTGVLTSKSNKVGTGLASGEVGASTDKGFKGFTDMTRWELVKENYPQLKVFSEDLSSQFGNKANYVKMHSMASTATVSLDTWDTGYDWDDTGVRKKEEVSYDRTLSSTGKSDHKGYDLTYDTVREIVSDCPVTSTSQWTHMIKNGAKVDIDSDGVADGNSMEVDSDKMLRIEMPGMDWFKISYQSGGDIGYRPIRLIAYMDVEAGADQSVKAGTKYDHRPDVRLRIMDKIVDNMVVGKDDDKIWSTAKQGGYPYSGTDPTNYLGKYWAVPTEHMESGFSAGKEAWIYTEIWCAKQNPDGSFVEDKENGYGSEYLIPDYSVKVTGDGTGLENQTLTEKKWNGMVDMYPDTTSTKKYIVSYYWMLKDGRYRTDYKIITFNPGKYNAGITVRNAEDDSLNDNALYLGAAADIGTNTGYTLSTETLSGISASDIGYTANSALAWKKRSASTKIVKAQLMLSSHSDIVYGSKTVTQQDLVAGNTITIPITYYYLTREHDNVQDDDREITNEEKLEVTYTIVQDAQGGLCLRFNKLKNAPDDENQGGDSSGIPAGALAYIDDTQFNIELTLWVRESNAPSTMNFEFIKTNAGENPLEGVEFQLFTCSHQHTDDCGGLNNPDYCNHVHSALVNQAADCCWNAGNPLQTAVSQSDGKVLFESLEEGDYMLVETKALPLYQLPQGQWMIHVNPVDDTVSFTAKGEKPPAFKTDTINGKKVISLPNYYIITLPQSGSMYKVLFIVAGVAVFGIAVIYLVNSRRKKQ